MLTSLLLATLSACGAQQVPAAEFLGAWCAREDPGQLLLVEEQRVGWVRGGQPSFHRVHARGANLTLERWSNLTELRLQREPDGSLRVEGDSIDLVFDACEIPEKLLVKPYVWPEGVLVDADTRAELVADLAARRVEDQRVRAGGSAGGQAEMDEMLRVDRDNVGFLKAVVEELGWIDAEPDTHGQEGCEPTQPKCEPSDADDR